MEEIWRDIPNCNGYQASSFGRVKNSHKGNILGKENGKRTNLRICGKSIQKAWFVAMAFQDICGEWFPGAFVDHIDTDKTNNRPENLRWVKGQKGNMENTKTRDNIRRSKIGNKNALKHKLSQEAKNIIAEKKGKKVGQYSLDGILISTYPSTKEAWRQTGINQSNINQCCLNRPHYHTAGGFIWQFIS